MKTIKEQWFQPGDIVSRITKAKCLEPDKKFPKLVNETTFDTPLTVERMEKTEQGNMVYFRGIKGRKNNAFPAKCFALMD